ncbi:hypothetical protein M2G36_21665 [Vibrio vulnificus]|nr:hypothetical protein [Vibrio floridensis]MCG6275564.1 hypothetical protein [Vibrio vulnificus]MCG6277964.1 hypothetical protein [Vibrio vulnificus]MCG6277966.1 hypothetical protein [Vibrio vulnificus]MCG6285645.1 hypothetical protein [Vibrio vulnificus]
MSFVVKVVCGRLV